MWFGFIIIFDVFFIFFLAMWVIFPAYLANAVMVPVSNKLKVKLHPLDNGRFIGESRVLGDGKTVEGTLLGIAIGTAGALVQYFLAPLFYLASSSWHNFYGSILVPGMDVLEYVGWNIGSLVRTFIYPAGAVFGDILGSFIKRRCNIPRGEKMPVVDQLDFIFGVMIVSLPFYQIGGSLIHVHVLYLIIILILTPPIHSVVNKLAHKIGIKDVAH
ncbi:MAG: CDP-archaeol synthase [Promethearchaeota archaeon]